MASSQDVTHGNGTEGRGVQAPGRRDQTILGMGVVVCGALLLLSGTVADGIGLAVGVAGIAVLANRPGEEADASGDDTPPDDDA